MGARYQYPLYNGVFPQLEKREKGCGVDGIFPESQKGLHRGRRNTPQHVRLWPTFPSCFRLTKNAVCLCLLFMSCDKVVTCCPSLHFLNVNGNKEGGYRSGLLSLDDRTKHSDQTAAVTAARQRQTVTT
jgi:hypothetical protein